MNSANGNCTRSRSTRAPAAGALDRIDVGSIGSDTVSACPEEPVPTFLERPRIVRWLDDASSFVFYRYAFTREGKAWWQRRMLGQYMFPVSLSLSTSSLWSCAEDLVSLPRATFH
jgi:hypothetical protein